MGARATAGSNSAPIGQAETVCGRCFRSPSTAGRHRMGRRRHDNNDQATPSQPSSRRHIFKWELAIGLTCQDATDGPMAGHGPPPDSRRLRGPRCEHVPISAACYVPDTRSIEPKLARVLGLYPLARMIPVCHGERHRNTAVGGPQHGGRMVGIPGVVFSLSKSSLRDEPAALFCNLDYAHLCQTTCLVPLFVLMLLILCLLQAGW